MKPEPKWNCVRTSPPPNNRECLVRCGDETAIAYHDKRDASDVWISKGHTYKDNDKCLINITHWARIEK